MVTFGSLSETSTEIRKYSRELYSKILEEETGQSTGFKPVGFIELAGDEDRLEEYRRVAAFNRKCGVDVQEIGPNDVKKLFPLCKTDDILAGFYVADDGRVNPVDATVRTSPTELFRIRTPRCLVLSCSRALLFPPRFLLALHNSFLS